MLFFTDSVARGPEIGMRKSWSNRRKLAIAAFLLALPCQSACGKSLPSMPLDQLSGSQSSASSKPPTAALFDGGNNSNSGKGENGGNASQTDKFEFGTITRKSDANSDSRAEAWQRYYNAGVQDLAARRYEVAEDRLNMSLKAARAGMGDDEKLMLSRIAMAQVFLALEKNAEAEKLFNSCLSSAKHLKGVQSKEYATCEEGLARLAFVNGKIPKAETLASDALSIRTKIDGPSHSTAKCMMLKASILSKNNWVDQAEATAIDGIKMLQEFPGVNTLDLADGFRETALLFHEHGKTMEAQELFEHSYKIIDASAKLNRPPLVEGQLVFRWEEGSPRSQEIPDADFPLKYLQVNNVRVAATVIDLWELYGVLISITNTGEERINAGLGKPMMYGASADKASAHFDKLQNIDPASIDRLRRERNMWDLTMNRPWLANMQKTRSQRGFVPKQGHDLFRGPNVFGVYGEWNALPRDLPSKLMLEPSPERVQYQAEPIIDPGLVRSSTVKLRDLVPISLEPFESRTGELFYLNPRCEKLLLSVPIGNVVYQIPFSAKRKRIN
jgi:tetratricopeptide (TPR) repeat protein